MGTCFSQRSLPDFLYFTDSLTGSHGNHWASVCGQENTRLWMGALLTCPPLVKEEVGLIQNTEQSPRENVIVRGNRGGVLSRRSLERYCVANLHLIFFNDLVPWNCISHSYISFLITFLFLFASNAVVSCSYSGGGLICVPSIALHSVITDNYILHTCTQCNPLQQSALVERNLTFFSPPSSKFEGNTYVIQ